MARRRLKDPALGPTHDFFPAEVGIARFLLPVYLSIPQTSEISGIFVALDADSKLIPSFIIGKRSSLNTQAFMQDLRYRIGDHRVQLTTDAYIFYRKAVEESFAGDADFAQLTKLYGDYGQFGNERY